MKTLIIDDDPQSHRVLTRLIEGEHPYIELQPGAYSVEEGIARIQHVKPELVFLDVELSDGLGFDILSKLDGGDFQVIFITAHNKYAITAFHFGAIHFLLKPIEKEALDAAMVHARASKHYQISPDQLALSRETYDKVPKEELPTRLVLVSNQDILYLKVAEIMRLEASNVYTLFHLQGEGQPLISSINLGKYVEQFGPYPTFVQTHRSHLINLNFVKKYNKRDRLVVMNDGSEISVSRRFLDDFQNGMQRL